MNDIQFTLNGKAVSYAGSAADRLLDVLRDTFRCTSVKCGCKEGECGACSVLLDGKLINSCCVAMGAVEGSTIVTLEGYRETERFAALDKAFAEVGAEEDGNILISKPFPVQPQDVGGQKPVLLADILAGNNEDCFPFCLCRA